jgi:geranylgeranyl diphosphate synthase type II
MRYSLLDAGKRLRPILVLATRDLYDRHGLDPMPAACALEMVHTYSLVHDDLPAMDDDDFRRGKPSSHKQFGEALAILAGDALLTEAFHVMGQAWEGCSDPSAMRVVCEIAAASGAAGMVGGQVLDILGAGTGLARKDLEKVQRLKTGALIRASVRCGAILGHAPDAELAVLTRCADRLGLAFQVVDDLLDVTASAADLGKTPGKDQAQGKTTWVSMLGPERANHLAAELIAAALKDLDAFGPAAADLRAIAGFFAARTR